MFKGYIIWLNIPWIVMGIGCTIGGVPDVLSYFKLREGNPHVLAFFASVILIRLQAAYWLFFRKGAEKLVRYLGPFSSSFSSPVKVQVIGLLVIVPAAVGISMLWMKIQGEGHPFKEHRQAV